MAEQRVFTLSQVAQHRSNKDSWLVIGGRVLDVTNFLEEHPGGEEVLIQSAGKDATKEFKDIGHSKAAENLLLKYQVGVLQGYSLKDADNDDAAPSEPSNKEMSAFVLNNDAIPRHTALFAFVVPLSVAASYLCCRYLMGVI